MRSILLLTVTSVLAAPPAVAQRARTDTSRADTTRLAPVTVSVTRSDARVGPLPWAIGVQTATDVRRGQATFGIDEALNNVPGVDVSNRYIYALDQRLSIRGAGSRANFGTRGVKVLLDGVPQSLPDGQSQLTNVELGNIDRVEVLRGAASSLYGNGSGGVISFESDMHAPDRLRQEARFTVASYAPSLGDATFDRATTKWQTRTIGRTDNAIGVLSISRTNVHGFRQFSDADVRDVNGAVDFALKGSTLQLRAADAEVPFSQNPGALTEAEWNKNADSAAAANIARDASRAVGQKQYSIGWKTTDERGDGLHVVAYALARTVDNPLATPPPAPAGFTNGTYNTIDRRLGGARLDVTRALGAAANTPVLTTGLDYERSRDLRKNWRSTGGKIATPTDTLLVDQTEIVSAFGPFAQVSWAPVARVLTSVGVRWDRQAFEVGDHFLADGKDNSGTRTMSAASGHLGASYTFSAMLTAYANVASAFDTPTTTELNARSDGAGGFSPDLNPQRTRTVEAGARGAKGRVSYDLSVFDGRTTDAIIQYTEVNGRAYFRNAGSTRSRGVELGLRGEVTSWIGARLAYTYADYRFDTYRVPRGTVTDTLDGKRMAGVPRTFVRAGIRASRRRVSLDADWTWSDKLFADDANTLKIPDWGHGRLDTRLTWSTSIAGEHVEPFIAVNNMFDQKYVGSITLNGAAGRVRESAPGRNWYAGIELAWSALR